MNDITGEIVHIPPFAADLKGLLTDLCDFANDDKNEPFIHPIIKGIIIHFAHLLMSVIVHNTATLSNYIIDYNHKLSTITIRHYYLLVCRH